MAEALRFDVNLFENASRKYIYNFNEISHLIADLETGLYEYPQYIVIKTILRLLLATQDFLAATTTDQAFANIRHDLPEESFSNILNHIAIELSTAELNLNRFSEDNEQYKLLTSALQYTYKVVVTRMVELKNTNDILYMLYWRESQLMKQINEHSSSMKG